VPLHEGGGQPAPLFARELQRVGGEDLHAYMISSGRAVLVDPAHDCLLVAPRDDRVEHPIADRRQVVGCEAGAQQPVGVGRQPDMGTQPIGSDGARLPPGFTVSMLEAVLRRRQFWRQP
jgi:hypothetical protein